MYLFGCVGSSKVALVVKNLPANAGNISDSGLIPGQEDPLERGLAAHSSILAWRIPWTEEPGGYSPWVAESQTRLKQLSTHGLGLDCGTWDLHCVIFTAWDLSLWCTDSQAVAQGLSSGSVWA